MKFTDFNAAQIRIARSTNRFEEVVDFYEKGIGLTRLSDFSSRDGYTGVIFGFPHSNYHLQFTKHIDGSPCPAPTKDNLFVFYIPEEREIEKVVARLQDMGYYEVSLENTDWKEKGIMIEDPDGWRVVLMNTRGI